MTQAELTREELGDHTRPVTRQDAALAEGGLAVMFDAINPRQRLAFSRHFCRVATFLDRCTEQLPEEGKGQ